MASKNEKVNAVMQILVSLIMLVLAILILTAPNAIFPQPVDQGLQKAAAGWLGAIIGYWLS